MLLLIVVASVGVTVLGFFSNHTIDLEPLIIAYLAYSLYAAHSSISKLEAENSK